MDNKKKCCLKCKYSLTCNNEERKGQLDTFYCEKFKWHSIYKSWNFKKKK